MYMDKFNVDNATYFLELHAHSESHHICAKHIRQALDAGGLSTTGHPINAKDYIRWLPTKGWMRLGILRSQRACDDFIKVGLMPGDIAVYGNPSKPAGAGHICMWTGHRWVSDFRQRGINVYKTFPGEIHIFRYNEQTKHPFDYGTV